MKTDFYITDFWGGKNAQLIAGGQTITENVVRCPSCNTFIENNEQEETISIWLDYLGKLGFSPFLWNSGLYTFLREDVVDVWKNAGITGYRTKKVIIRGWYNKTKKDLPADIPNYFSIEPTSLVTLIEPKPIGNPCDFCGFQKYDFPVIGTYLPNGIHVDMQSWNGSDINAIQKYSMVICTEKVVRATLNAALGSFLPFVRLEKYLTWDMFDIRKRSPKEYDKYLEQFLIGGFKFLVQQDY